MFNFKQGFLCTLIVTCFAKLFAQVVTISPSFATQSDTIIVQFDASKGNSQLAGQAVVYAHTGVITDKSATPSAWKYVQGNWGTDDAKVKMTNIGNNLFQLKYHINSYYGVPAGEKVLKLAFVFRNVNGSLVGREADGGDIYVPLSDGAYTARFSLPSIPGTLLTPTDSIRILGISSLKSNLKLYVNDSLYMQLSNDSIITKTLYASQLGLGKFKLVLIGTLSGKSAYDTSYFIVRSGGNIGVAPNGIVDGINYINDSTVILQLFAPYKSFVYAIGDFSNWELDPLYEMKNTPDGNRYWIRINNLEKLKEYRYQYIIDKELIRIADPYTDKVLDPNNDQFIPAITYPSLIPFPSGKTSGNVSVFQTAQPVFNWQYSSAFNKPDAKNLIIYELLIRDFIGRHDYQTLMDTLNYLQSLGINAIELMPFNEFEGNESWGYNTSFYFAPDKYYGTKNALKLFIDECHRRGIAVIMDMVLNHSFGQSPMVRMYFNQATGKPASNNPWFNSDAKHPFNVGYDFNHESMYTQNLVDTVLRYWIREYKVDGYRFDLSKGFTQTNNPTDVAAWGNYDLSRINIWKRIAYKLRVVQPDCYMILEHFADNSEEKVLSDYGFMLWGNMNGAYTEASMGYAGDFTWASYKARGWNQPNLVTYMESHDEERMMYKNITYGNSVSGYSVKNLNTALARTELAATLFIPVPGPKMIWQFGEQGYDVNIDFNGRIGNKPIRWEYLNNANRRRVHDVYAALNKLKLSEPAFSTSNFTFSSASTFKVLKLSDSTMNVLIAGNFAMTPVSQIPGFHHSGIWYDYFAGDSMFVNSTNDTLKLIPGEYRLFTDKRLKKPVITAITGINAGMDLNEQFLAYPNPVQSVLSIEIPDEFVGNEEIKITLINNLGQNILMKSFKNLKLISLNVEPISRGFYFIKISSTSFNKTQKILIN